jgi:hypothetical protein
MNSVRRILMGKRGEGKEGRAVPLAVEYVHVLQLVVRFTAPARCLLGSTGFRDSYDRGQWQSSSMEMSRNTCALCNMEDGYGICSVQDCIWLRSLAGSHTKSHKSFLSPPPPLSSPPPARWLLFLSCGGLRLVVSAYCPTTTSHHSECT